MQIFYLALRMSILINAPNPLRLPVPLRTFVEMCTTAWMAFKKELKAFRRISVYPAITSLRISFGTPLILGAVFALSFLPALFSSSRLKISSRRITQELQSCLWNDFTCGNKLRTMYLTQSGLSRPGVFFLVTNLLVTILQARPHGSPSTRVRLAASLRLSKKRTIWVSKTSRSLRSSSRNTGQELPPETWETSFSPLSEHVRHLGGALQSLAACPAAPHL